MGGRGLWLAYRMSSFSSLPCARMTRMRLRIWPATALAWASASYRQAGRQVTCTTESSRVGAQGVSGVPGREGAA